ncbi:MAG: arylsulfatase [Planctomycetota bacterium]
MKLKLLLLACFLFGFSQHHSALHGQRPNFVVIIADDLGYSDLGCYGGEIETPHLDRLAADGLRFTQFYNTARCWPTRSALMTGYYPQQIRRDQMPEGPKGFGNRGKRPPWAQTIAERVREAGYRTYHSGKWHIDGKPLENGFDRSDETSRGPGFFDSVRRENRDEDFYRTTATAQHAIDCLKEHARDFSNRSFFQYIAFHAPHFPLHALPEDIAKYRHRYDVGWDDLRKQRFQKQNELGFEFSQLSPLEPTLGPPYDFPSQIEQLGAGEINRPRPWHSLSPEQKRFQSVKMGIHAAMVDRMDQEIGRVLRQLKEMNSAENTVVCFLSDNGASAEIMVRGDGHDPEAEPGSAATYLCLGPGFSSAANTPFRRHKTWVHEGGTSTPFIVRWPKGIASKNELRSTVAHVIDLAPTILDLAKITPPTNQSSPAMSGLSLRAALNTSDDPGHQELWFYHEGNAALRSGDWKVIRSGDSRPFPYREDVSIDEFGNPSAWSLHNLKEDRAEQNDLATQFPERTARMVGRWIKLRNQFLSDATEDAGSSDR